MKKKDKKVKSKLKEFNKENIKELVSKLKFWKNNNDLIEDNYFDNLLNSFFMTKESEKKTIIDLFEKKGIEYFLFYTDHKNWQNILDYGIRPVKRLILKPTEEYVVWSYQQQEHSILLEFDVSSRAHFWKWMTDTGFNPKEVMIIGINPKHLAKSTKKDWIWDRSKSMAIISEDIQVESIDWIMFRSYQVYRKAQQAIEQSGLKIKLYFGTDGVVKQESRKEHGKAIR
ncbi:hypothetical protein [Mycoplasma putrefaciens]|uniref:Uncharacterized protein n=1 Tax=Mycoplasma putrefaciens (strain ATCC 15718 / NCTC 10155 / C30 KS-1 / KS-1) TaxID=743965 RepID=A0A7U3ZT05_MYCPK|nr:hypothetical protein [Mycoplasma putrefaciens]AEM68941.1 uncharacterized protein MPUT_0586 [Mycoplasma putrefaciens KS1]